MALRLIGTDPWLKCDARVATELLGSSYGGWYVATSLLPSSPIVVSLGIGGDITFDRIMVERFGASVVACDPTPLAADTVLRAQLPASCLSFLPAAVSDYDGQGTFEPVLVGGQPTGCYRLAPADPSDGARIGVAVRSLASLIRERCPSGLDVLKMDIEGAEYEAIPDLLSAGLRPGQILVEFHHRFADRGTAATLRVVRMLREAGYALVRLSDQGPEYTFVHERLARSAGSTAPPSTRVDARPIAAPRSRPDHAS